MHLSCLRVARSSHKHSLPPQRMLPFLSSDVDEYLQRYWAVMFTVASRPVESGHIRHYLSWYCTRLKVVELDHHLYASTLRRSLYMKTNTSDLPLLFVNQKLVGTINDVQKLEEKRLLKDVLQFGFQWKTGSTVGHAPQALNTIPAAYNDKELFHACYRGAPVARAVTQLPQLHPFHRSDDDENAQWFHASTTPESPLR